MTIRQPLLSSAPVQRYIIVGMLRIEYALPYYYNSIPYSFFSKNSSCYSYGLQFYREK
jgi:hypothetical protein